MEQLEEKTYSKTEICEILGIDPNDSKHYKRNVETKLTKWGYGFLYTSKAITITKKPATNSDRLKELLIRRLDLDIQINPFHYACFICAFQDIDGFESMPWAERETEIEKKYGIRVSSRTLRNWCSKLIQKELVAKTEEKTYWKTSYANGQSVRTFIQRNDPQLRKYFKKKNNFLTEFRKDALRRGMSPKEAERIAWKQAMEFLWAEFRCCYYSCKSLLFNAFETEDAPFFQEVVELTHKIVHSQ